MEVVIGLVIFIIIWKLLSGKAATKMVVEKEIMDLYRKQAGMKYFSSLHIDRYKEYAESKEIVFNEKHGNNDETLAFHLTLFLGNATETVKVIVQKNPQYKTCVVVGHPDLLSNWID